MNTEEELKNTLLLLKIEQHEELNQYRVKVLETPLSVRKKQGITWYPVIISDTTISFGQKLLVEIEKTTDLETSHSFQTGKTIALFSNSENNKKENPFITGIITYAKGKTLKVALNSDELPDWIEDGKLGVDLFYDEKSYKEMDYAINKLLTTDNKNILRLREVLLGNKDAEFYPENHNINFPELNESQNQAIRKIDSAKDVAIIHGPPGTGKTTTIIKAIEHTLKSEAQILVSAPSNMAVDLLTEKLTEAGISVVRIGHPARITERLQKYSLDEQIINHPEYKELIKLQKQANDLRKKAIKFKRNFDREARENRQAMLAEVKSMISDAKAMEKNIIGNIFDKAQVITCTLVGASNEMLRGKIFETVFIDEAAQALEGATWIPIIRSNRVIFAGDHHQLPPTIKSIEASKKGMNITLFEKTIKRQKADVMLDTQYRMHEDIMNFSNDQFYDSGLRADASVRERTLSTNSDNNLIFTSLSYIDTAGCGYLEEINPETLSSYNTEEAMLLIRHFERLIAQLNNSDNEDISIGIISPYKEQVILLKDLFSKLEVLQNINISVDTIDGFQGQERDIIYISLVRSNDESEIGFLSDTRRMNVAMTRAKKKLIIIGDSSTISSNLFYKDFLDYVDSVEAYSSAWEFMD